MTPPERREARGEAGVVYVEFLFAFIPIFILFLGIVQFALLFGAQVTVQQAVQAAARSAAVVLPDDPARYAGTPLGVLRTPRTTAQQSSGRKQRRETNNHVKTLLGKQASVGKSSFPPADARAPRSPRLAAITLAAHFPLAALSPSFTELENLVPGRSSKGSLRDALGGEHAGRAAVGLWLYADAVTAITFPKGEGASEVYDRLLDPSVGMVHVRVLHLFRCAVPIVARWMCRSPSELGVSALRGVRRKRGVPARMTSQLRAIPSQAGLRLIAASGQYVFPFEEEASFPQQTARYPYPTP